MVQITAQHDNIIDIRNGDNSQSSMYSLKPMHAIHVSVIPTGKNDMDPICITLPKPDNSVYDVRMEIERILNNNRSDLTTCYSNNDLYWKMRRKQNEQMIVSRI